MGYKCCSKTGALQRRRTFEVQVDTVLSSPGLSLADDDGGHDLLSQFGLTLLDGGQNHVTDTGGGQSVKTSLDTFDGDDVKVLGSAVVGAVHDGAHGETEGHTVLVA